MKKLIVVILMLWVFEVWAEGGDAPIDGSRGNYEGADNIHWYMQDTLRWSALKADFPFLGFYEQCNTEDESLSCEGRNLPRETPLFSAPYPGYINLYIQVDSRIDFSWRVALKEVRDVNRAFLRSGIRAKLVVSAIEAVDMTQAYGDDMEQAWDMLVANHKEMTRTNEADIIVVLMEDNATRPYCGLGSLGETYDIQFSVVACRGDHTLAHEIGHNLGLDHDVDAGGLLTPFVDNGYGFVSPMTGCGTIMATSDCSVPFFSNPAIILQAQFSEDTDHYGSADANSAEAANSGVLMISLANEVTHREGKASAKTRPNKSENGKPIDRNSIPTQISDLPRISEPRKVIN